MSTESEVILARYKTVEKEADSFGRVIGVRRLKPSEQAKIAGMCSDLAGNDEVIGPDGEKVQIPHRMPLLIASTVCMIDGTHIPFPRDRRELDAIYDRLDQEGITAAGTALARLSEDDPTVPVDASKNL